MLAYNQSKYIADSIDNILSQECSFDFELVIGEDCSTDNTREICERYALENPDKIRLLPSEKNLGIHANFLRTLQACSTAKYVAFCEGDDKWIDKGKLQHQVTFLENNPRAIAHTHNAIYRDLRTNVDRNFGVSENSYLITDQLFNKWPYHPVTLMVRSSILRNIPYNKLPYFISADRFLSMWIGTHGEVYYEGEATMSIYHRHDAGASANSDYPQVRSQNMNLLEFFKPFVKEKAVYNTAVKGYTEGYYIALARSPEKTPCDRNRIKDLLNYACRSSLSEFKKNIYIILLIILGRQFYNFSQRNKSA
jgi:glycosyltransferase involved in cell wall biosynthesis